MKTKKAELKIQEMAFMLVAVVFLFVVIGLFGLAIFQESMYEEFNSINEQRTYAAVNNLADSPELYCVSSRSNCIDADKLISLINKSDYINYYPFSSLKVVKMSGFEKSYEEMALCNFFNYPDCELFIIFEKEDKGIVSENVKSTFVSLCYKEYDIATGYTYDKCEIAKILAGSEQRIIKNEN
jgi:hypothetical protein